MSPVTQVTPLHSKRHRHSSSSWLSLIFNCRNPSSLSSPDSDSYLLSPYLTGWREDFKCFWSLHSYTGQSENPASNSMHHITFSSLETISLLTYTMAPLGISSVWLGLILSYSSSMNLLIYSQVTFFVICPWTPYPVAAILDRNITFCTIKHIGMDHLPWQHCLAGLRIAWAASTNLTQFWRLLWEAEVTPGLQLGSQNRHFTYERVCSMYETWPPSD